MRRTNGRPVWEKHRRTRQGRRRGVKLQLHRPGSPEREAQNALEQLVPHRPRVVSPVVLEMAAADADVRAEVSRTQKTSYFVGGAQEERAGEDHPFSDGLS